MSKKQILTIVVLLVVCALIVVVPLMTLDSDFGGADGAAEELISQVDPDYEPWAESLIELPGGETETLLFCLQTALGAVVIGFGFGYLVARKKYRTGEAT